MLTYVESIAYVFVPKNIFMKFVNNKCIQQTMDVDQQQLHRVCDHLGHSWDVHRQHFRQMSDILERAMRTVLRKHFIT